MSIIQRIVMFAAVAAMGCGGASTAVRADEGAPAAADGAETFDSPTGEKVTLDTKHLKRRTLLVFAADFCPICRRETSEFVALAKEKRGQVDVVGVVMDSERSAARHYVDSQKVTYPTIWDPEWRFAMRYKVKATPTLVLLAEDGSVEAVASGLTDALKKKL